MKFFLDTEFIERGPGFPIELISIGIVCENGSEYYAESSDYDPNTASDWIKENVFPNLFGCSIPLKQIAEEIREFVDSNCAGTKPEFWGYYADYDWVVFCQLFDRMIDLPAGWPKYCLDLKQLAITCGNPTLPPQTGTKHLAVADARWNSEIYNLLRFELSLLELEE